jgi:hypothetical protein
LFFLFQCVNFCNVMQRDATGGKQLHCRCCSSQNLVWTPKRFGPRSLECLVIESYNFQTCRVAATSKWFSSVEFCWTCYMFIDLWFAWHKTSIVFMHNLGSTFAVSNFNTALGSVSKWQMFVQVCEMIQWTGINNKILKTVTCFPMTSWVNLSIDWEGSGVDMYEIVWLFWSRSAPLIATGHKYRRSQWRSDFFWSDNIEIISCIDQP